MPENWVDPMEVQRYSLAKLCEDVAGWLNGGTDCDNLCFRLCYRAIGCGDEGVLGEARGFWQVGSYRSSGFTADLPGMGNDSNSPYDRYLPIKKPPMNPAKIPIERQITAAVSYTHLTLPTKA